MSFTWGAVIGFATPIPYFYSVFFIVVLIHRCSRDFERCVIVFLPCVDNNSWALLQMLNEVWERLGPLLLYRQIQVYPWDLLI